MGFIDKINKMCDVEKEDAKDTDVDSIISDRCWKETYKGDSRKWLLRDVTRNSLQGAMSAMKESYQYPEQIHQPEIGQFNKFKFLREKESK